MEPVDAIHLIRSVSDFPLLRNPLRHMNDFDSFDDPAGYALNDADSEVEPDRHSGCTGRGVRDRSAGNLAVNAL